MKDRDKRTNIAPSAWGRSSTELERRRREPINDAGIVKPVTRNHQLSLDELRVQKKVLDATDKVWKVKEDMPGGPAHKNAVATIVELVANHPVALDTLRGPRG